jgi:hypothetical protein
MTKMIFNIYIYIYIYIRVTYTSDAPFDAASIKENENIYILKLKY